MKIAIIGTRGIPNTHGGFEQFAEIFSVYAVKMGHEVLVYNVSDHSYKLDNFKGVKIIHKFNPERWLRAFGQFIYDLNCIINLKKHKPDVILQLGYTSSSVWGFLLPKNIMVFTNMDGLEWKRQKYSKPVQHFLKQAESWAVKTSNHLIADSLGIQNYLKQKYNKESYFIPYGAEVFNDPNQNILKKYSLEPYQYNMLIARMEPENSIEMILQAVVKSQTSKCFLVIGSCQKTKFGQMLLKKYAKYQSIKFLGAIYDQNILNNLRYYSNLYCHGHSVGGTNPSLLEAMGSSALIAAHDNDFNRYILNDDGFYFDSSEQLSIIFNDIDKKDYKAKVEVNLNKIATDYSWTRVNDQYINILKQA